MRVIEEALVSLPLIIPHHEEAILGFRSAVAAAHAAGIKIDADAPLSARAAFMGRRRIVSNF